MTSPIRVLVVDDDSMAAAGMNALLSTQDDIVVVGQCVDGDEVAAAITAHRPHVVLCDMRMQRMGGLETVIALRDVGPAFLMMTAFDEDGIALQAVEAGACGFMLKGDDPKRIISAVRLAADGLSELSPRALTQLVQWVQHDGRSALRRESEAKVAQLTPREREFAIAVAQGATDAELAARFFVAETTVKSTLSGIRTKLGARTRTDLAVTTVRAGIA